MISSHDIGSVKSLIVAALFTLLMVAGITSLTKGVYREVIDTEHTDIPSARTAFHECLNKHVDGAITTAEFRTVGTCRKFYIVRCETVRQE
jgi:hypothetical protein